MEKLQLHYSPKNIPIPSERSYKLQLMDKIDQVIKGMRWKAFFYMNRSEDTQETYGLKSLNCPPKIKEMVPFEKDLWNLVNKSKFRKIKSKFQRQLNEDIREIKRSNKVLVFADKTSNIYKLDTDEYKKLRTEAITSTYKKVPDKINDKINTEGKRIMKNKTALNRMFINGKNNCFITLKDHKTNFLNNPKTRLLNPAKNELGRISKAILDKINLNLRNATKVNQWKNTNDVISWFKSIKNKKNCKFISFDIKDFYPTITKELLSKCLNFAETKVQITEDDKKIIYHSRKSLLFDKGNTWMKKKGGDIFDVAMGTYDGAEVCKLVGTFLLEKISEVCNKSNIGLYRDDGLSIFRKKSGTQLEKMKKKLQRLFKEYDLEITAESNLKIVNYLDVTFNLKDGTFRPYHKPDDQIQYIHTESNHPPPPPKYY